MSDTNPTFKKLVRCLTLFLALALFISSERIAQAERLDATDPLTQELFEIYQQSQVALVRRDEEAYLATLSQGQIERLQKAMVGQQVGSFRDVMDRIVELEGERLTAKSIPRWVERSNGEAILFLLAGTEEAVRSETEGMIPVGSGWKSRGQVAFVKESSGWKKGLEKGESIPPWMSVRLFELSQEKTTLIPPASWTAKYPDVIQEFDGWGFNDLKEIAFSNDVKFLYILISFTQTPTVYSGRYTHLYFDTDQDSSTGNSDSLFAPKVSGWERQLALGFHRLPSVDGTVDETWAYEVNPAELGTPRAMFHLTLNNGWVLIDGSDLILKVPLGLLDLKPGATFRFTVVDIAGEPLDTMTRGEYTLTAS